MDREMQEVTGSEFQLIPLSNIDTNNQSVRDERADDHVTELAMSIAKNGLMHPIVVQREENGRYQLVAGFHRLCAISRLQWEKIPAHIQEEKDTPVKARALIENIIRRDLTLEEECQAVTHLFTQEKLSPSQMCDLLGKSRAWVDRRLMAPNLPEKVREALFEGIISLGVAEMIGGVENEGIRNQILQQTIAAKLTALQVRELIGVYSSAPSVQEAIQAGLQTAAEIQTQKTQGRRCDICEQIIPIKDLIPIWVCRAGCRPPESPPPEGQGETE